MKNNIDYTKVPFNYLHCIKRECKQAHHCLRQLAEQAIPDKVLTCTIIHPSHLSDSDEKCLYYRSDAKVAYAKGFTNMLGDLKYRDTPNMIDRLKSHFGWRTYYRVRKGERLLSPDEQLSFKKVLKSNGFTPSKDFDSYEEDYLW